MSTLRKRVSAPLNYFEFCLYDFIPNFGKREYSVFAPEMFNVSQKILA